MSFLYLKPEAEGSLRQGEILKGICEHRAISTALDTKADITFRTIRHELSVVISPDCDLYWDWAERQEEKSPAKLVSSIILLDLVEKANIRDRIKNAKEWNAVKSKKLSRFHFLPSAAIKDEPSHAPLPELLADFKGSFSVSPEALYSAAHQENTIRLCRIPDVYLHDLLQRCFSFLARVSLPD